MTDDVHICPVCESPLTTDAVRQGKCQCCGSPLPEQESKSAREAENGAAGNSDPEKSRNGRVN
jgi:predicted amidophosphoribosyltransferase